MANVIKRTVSANLIHEFIQSANTPDYPTEAWLANPDISALISVPTKYWKVSGDTVVEMSQLEKEAVDTSNAATPKVYKEIKTGTITTTSADPVLISGLAITPAAGTYQCFLSGVCYTGSSNANKYCEMSIFANSIQSEESISPIWGTSSSPQPFRSMAIVTVDGTQTIEGKWLRTNGAGTASITGTRSLILVRMDQ